LGCRNNRVLVGNQANRSGVRTVIFGNVRESWGCVVIIPGDVRQLSGAICKEGFYSDKHRRHGTMLLHHKVVLPAVSRGAVQAAVLVKLSSFTSLAS